MHPRQATKQTKRRRGARLGELAAVARAARPLVGPHLALQRQLRAFCFRADGEGMQAGEFGGHHRGRVQQANKRQAPQLGGACLCAALPPPQLAPPCRRASTPSTASLERLLSSCSTATTSSPGWHLRRPAGAARPARLGRQCAHTLGGAGRRRGPQAWQQLELPAGHGWKGNTWEQQGHATHAPLNLPVLVQPHVRRDRAAVEAAAGDELQVGGLVDGVRDGGGDALAHRQHLRRADGLGEEACSGGGGGGGAPQRGRLC